MEKIDRTKAYTMADLFDCIDDLRAEVEREKEERANAVDRHFVLAMEYHNLSAEVERWKEEHGNACLLVSKMHHAAVGAITGPKQGVVEDVEDMKAERDAAFAVIGKVRNLIETNQLGLTEFSLGRLRAILDGKGE